ncbi:alpha/beta fold hydrolase [Planococcus sp. CP5-4]|uniref:alpha/beta hydrolase n=1 Tax=unclassified Planococcus (in: firmicutes) TaxID=2662419 RepID=UPI001C23ED5E|nr:MULTISPECIES: alpha/beta fold hydrolase [unclassified Planococcus (in: firmicutes)]MBU9674239.1 alpha/beta fold hydrolase [Planococcus sp. CP5-4_YE]MBV0909289.1 alpha/beta fold hydrolase [Planococcus sp. CP5-4_UN]MBW6063781.1 alpha/beta fold hydrolase [Planococcus sp. CP5-4]
MNEQYPVIQGAETFFLRGNSTGILLCHGFLGTPQSVRELGEALGTQGYTVSCPRLPGHGTHFKDLDQCSYDDWFESVKQAYLDLKQSCTSVFVIGQSMGGTLSLDLASRHPEIQGLALINPAIDIPQFENHRNCPAHAYVTEDAPDIKKADAVEITYGQAPIKAYQQLLGYMDTVRPKLGEVRCPVVCFQSLEDHVVPPGNTDYILCNISSDSKQKYELNDSYHIASMDHETEYIVEMAVRFVKENSTLPVRTIFNVDV